MFPASSIHRLRLGLPGYLILFAPLAFEPQRQYWARRPPSQLVFFQISSIPPLHLEFHLPLPYSRKAVLKARYRLSRYISLLTYFSAYALFTPSDSEQRLLPTYYRGCWHVVSRSFLDRYRQSHAVLSHDRFFPINRGLQPEGIHPSRGVAASDFRPLRKIPYCCLP